MIIKPPYGVSPNYDLTIGNAQVDYQALNSIELCLEENKHDMLKLEMAGLPPRAVTEYRGLGVRLTFDTGPGYQDEFTGYVTEVKPHSHTSAGLMNNSPFQDVTIVCMGASFDMRGAKSRPWEETTLGDVARQFAKDYKMSLDAPQNADERVYRLMLQDSESDWQFLVRYAGLLGYSVSGHNTHLHIYDPFLAASRQISYNKLMTSRGSKLDGTAVPGRISDFKGRFTRRHADGVFKNSVVTVQQDDGLTYDVDSREVFRITTGTAPRLQDNLSHPVETYAEAIRVINRRSREEYDYEATIEVVGLAGCQPGGVISLDNYAAEFDGLWYVRGVDHRLASGGFVSTLDVARNVRSELESGTITERLQSPPQPVWFNNKWQSSKRRYRAY